MNTNQYTQKTLEALQAAQQLAVEYQHNALEPEHLLHALATQEQGLIPQLLQKLNVDATPGSRPPATRTTRTPTGTGGVPPGRATSRAPRAPSRTSGAPTSAAPHGSTIRSAANTISTNSLRSSRI